MNIYIYITNRQILCVIKVTLNLNVVMNNDFSKIFNFFLKTKLSLIYVRDESSVLLGTSESHTVSN